MHKVLEFATNAKMQGINKSVLYNNNTNLLIPKFRNIVESVYKEIVGQNDVDNQLLLLKGFNVVITGIINHFIISFVRFLDFGTCRYWQINIR